MKKQEDISLLIIFDLDKTSIYCPIADFMDRFIPKNKTLKQIYYKIYPFIHTLEMKFGLCKINEKMYSRVKSLVNQVSTDDDITADIYFMVLTARHETFQTYKHVDLIFKEYANDIDVCCVAQGITGLSKAEYLDRHYNIADHVEIIMYDDNYKELVEMKKKYGSRFTGFKVMMDKNGNEVYVNKC